MSLLDANLPNNRRWMRVGDYYAITKKPRGMDMSFFSLIPFAPMGAIPQGGEYDASYTLKPFSDIASGTYFEKGDILIAKITPSFENGKQSLALNLPADFGYATTEIIPLHPINNEQDRRLLFFYLLHPDIRSYVAEKMEGSTGRQRVPERVLLDLPFPQIDKDDQKIIADSLYLIQKSLKKEIDAQKNSIELKRATMRELFTRGLKGEAQKETEIGQIPQNWDVKKLSEICNVLPGYAFKSKEYKNNGVRLFKIANVSFGVTDWQDISFLPENFLEKSKKFNLYEGDIVMAMTRPVVQGGIKVARIIKEDTPALLNQRVCKIIPKNISSNYIYQIMFTNWFIDGIQLGAGGSQQPNISAAKIGLIKVPVPKDPIEQCEIAQILNAIDRKIDLHKRKKAVLEELFKSLLHKLMTGEIRVSDLDLSILNYHEEAGA